MKIRLVQISASFKLTLQALFFLLFLSTEIVAETVNGAPAIDLLGQYDQTSLSDPVPAYSKQEPHDAPNRLGFSYPSHAVVDTVDHRLFISEAGRVLVYNLDSGNQIQDWIPDNVIGQANFYTRTSGSGANGFGSVSSLAYYSTSKLLFVADYTNSRVLVFDCTSIADGENAVRVLGQTDFTANSATVDANTLGAPTGLAINTIGNILYVGDQPNHRVLVFDISTITNGEAAFRVLGQSDFTSHGASVSQSSIVSPEGLAFDQVSNRLFVSQIDAHRVTVFDVATITNGEAATSVLGQSNFTLSTAAVSSTGLSFPKGIAYNSANSHLYVGSDGRVLVYDTASISNGEAAINVLGEGSFTSSSTAASASGTGTPGGLFVDAATNSLFASDTDNHRIVVFDISSLTDGESALSSIGQFDDASSVNPLPVLNKSGEDNSPSRFGFYFPEAIALDEINHRLFVADTTNNRVLGFDLTDQNALEDHNADLVLGQPDFVSSAEAVSITGLSGPRGLALDQQGQRLFVADSFVRRVLVYDLSIISSGAAATNVIGQSSFTSSTSGTNSTRFAHPEGLAFDSHSNRLFVADFSNSRVMVFDTTTISNGEAAVAVLGQPDFISSTGSTTQSGLNAPIDLTINDDGTRLFVADASNRVVVYDVETISDGENAVAVLGQSNFTSSSIGNLTSGLSSPRGLALDDATNTLFVVEGGRHRLVTFDVASITNGEAAVNVLGQVDFNGISAAVTQTGLNGPYGVAILSSLKRLFVADRTANRIMVLPFNYSLTLSATEFDEDNADNGSISTTITATLLNDTFAISSGPLTENTHFTVTNLPAGLTMAINISSPTQATIQLSGMADSHFNSEDIQNLTLSFSNAAFSNINAASIQGAQNIAFSIDFQGTPTPTPTATPSPTFTATPTKTPSSSITGTIIFPDSSPVSVYVSASGLGSVASTLAGDFTLTGISDGSTYTVTPKKEGLLFTPTSVSVTSLSDPVTFTAIAVQRNLAGCSAKNRAQLRAAIDSHAKSILSSASSILEIAQQNLLLLPQNQRGAVQSKLVELGAKTNIRYNTYLEGSLQLPVEWLTCKGRKRCKFNSVSRNLSKVPKLLSNLANTAGSLANYTAKKFISLKAVASQTQRAIQSAKSKAERKLLSLPEVTYNCDI